MRLADLLSRRGDLGNAIAVLRAPADAGDGPAGVILADLLAERGDLEGLRARADAPGASSPTSTPPGSWPTCWSSGATSTGLRARADTGDTYAARGLAGLLAERGDFEELRARADAGDDTAAWLLASLLAEREELESLRMEVLRDNKGAVEQLRKTVATQNPSAAEHLRRYGQHDGTIPLEARRGTPPRPQDNERCTVFRKARALLRGRTRGSDGISW